MKRKNLTLKRCIGTHMEENSSGFSQSFSLLFFYDPWNKYYYNLFIQGFRAIPAKDYWWKSYTPLMKEVRDLVGEQPVYITLDIDALDPAFAPGTGNLLTS